MTPAPGELAAKFRALADIRDLAQRIADQVEPVLLFRLQNEAPVRTGALLAGITPLQEPMGDGVTLSFYDGVPYIRYVIEGTEPHLIMPRSAKVLVFYADSGDLVFAHSVNHPGTAPNPFPQRAWEAARDEVTTLAAETTRAYVREVLA